MLNPNPNRIFLRNQTKVEKRQQPERQPLLMTTVQMTGRSQQLGQPGQPPLPVGATVLDSRGREMRQSAAAAQRLFDSASQGSLLNHNNNNRSRRASSVNEEAGAVSGILEGVGGVGNNLLQSGLPPRHAGAANASSLSGLSGGSGGGSGWGGTGANAPVDDRKMRAPIPVASSLLGGGGSGGGGGRNSPSSRF